MRSFLFWFLVSFFALAYPQAASADSPEETFTSTAAPEEAMAASDQFDTCLFSRRCMVYTPDRGRSAGTEAAVWLTSVAVDCHHMAGRSTANLR